MALNNNEYQIYLKHLDDGYFVATGINEKDAIKKLKKWMLKTLRTDFDNKIAINKMKVEKVKKIVTSSQSSS